MTAYHNPSTTNYHTLAQIEHVTREEFDEEDGVGISSGRNSGGAYFKLIH